MSSKRKTLFHSVTTFACSPFVTPLISDDRLFHRWSDYVSSVPQPGLSDLQRASSNKHKNIQGFLPPFSSSSNPPLYHSFELLLFRSNSQASSSLLSSNRSPLPSVQLTIPRHETCPLRLYSRALGQQPVYSGSTCPGPGPSRDIQHEQATASDNPLRRTAQASKRDRTL